MAAVNGSLNPFSLAFELIRIGSRHQSTRVIDLVFALQSDPPGNNLAAVQTGLDEFLFFVNDFCGIPTLSDATLDQLNVYFLVDLVNAANINP